jgi:hypothetical protein
MANKNIYLSTSIPNSGYWSPHTTLYINENVVFSEIDEFEENPNRSVTRDIDLTQQNIFSLLFTDLVEGGLDTFKITLDPTGGTGYNVIFNVNFSEVYHSNLNKLTNFKFKINDTIVKSQTSVTVDDLPVTNNSSINWNGTDKLSFYIDYQVESTKEPYEPITNIFDHNIELSLS